MGRAGIWSSDVIWQKVRVGADECRNVLIGKNDGGE